MANEIQVFENSEFGELEIIEINGKPYFLATKCAEILGYTNPQKAIRDHCKGVNETFTPTKGGQQSIKIMPEGDLYRLIIRSKLPSAEKFEKWVFDEVLPAIRKHGAYLTPKTSEELIANPDLIIDIANALKAERAERQRLEQSNQTLLIENSELKPKAYYADYILSGAGALAITQIAADYSMSARKLNKILEKERVQHSVGGQWILYVDYMDKGYTKSETFAFTHTDGTPYTKIFTKWTQKGRLLINEILNKQGIYANMDIVSRNPVKEE